MSSGERKSGDIVELPTDRVRRHLTRALVEALEVDEAAAVATIDHLIRSEQAGKASHGLIRVHYVACSGKFGPYGGARDPEPEARAAGWLHVEGADRLGYSIMHGIIEAGCTRALRDGHCLLTGAGVYPSGCLGDWARLAAERGVASIITGGSPPRVAGPGGGRPVVGTNPLCVGVPGEPLPFISDASTSAITHGELILARNIGEPIAQGTAVDSDGRESTDAAAVDPTKGLGALLTVGASHKTFAMAMALELLTSLGGGVPGSSKLAEHGVFVHLIGPDVLGDTPERVSRWLGSLDESGVRIPGWNSGRQLADQQGRGVVRVARRTTEVLSTWLEPLQA